MLILSEHALAVSNDAERKVEKPVILHMSIIDNSSFTDSAVNETDRFLKAVLPQARLISVKTHTSRYYHDAQAIRTSLLRQLRKRTDSNDRITHLVIDTHGNTFNENGESVTQLAHLGGFTASKIDDDLSEILAPLKGLFVPDAKVVFNSCLTFCGEAPDVTARAKTFLNELGITDGQIYGATVTEMDSVGGYIRKHSMKRALMDWRQFRFYVGIGMALGIPISAVLDHGSVTGFTTTYAATSVSVGAALHSLMQVLKRIASKDRSFNRGRLLVFRNGEQISDTRVRKYEDKLRIYGAHCSAVFADL